MYTKLAPPLPGGLGWLMLRVRTFVGLVQLSPGGVYDLGAKAAFAMLTERVVTPPEWQASRKTMVFCAFCDRRFNTPSISVSIKP
jgi:hypothetical protein